MTVPGLGVTMSIYAIQHSDSRLEDGRLAITVTGEIDMANAVAFAELIEATIQSGEARLVLDLAGVSFIDSSGLTALVVALRAATEAGGSLSLRAIPSQAMELLVVTGLDTLFPLEAA